MTLNEQESRRENGGVQGGNAMVLSKLWLLMRSVAPCLGVQAPVRPNRPCRLCVFDPQRGRDAPGERDEEIDSVKVSSNKLTSNSAYVALASGSFIMLPGGQMDLIFAETAMTDHKATKSPAVSLYPSGIVGGGPCTMAVNCAKTFEYVSGG
jgi:hypothetical protein